jgi:PiT family inorganic phosphate transporter
VLGAGAIRGFSAVRWGVAGNILVAWIFTIPMAALVGGSMQLVTRIEGGDVIVLILTSAIAATAFLARGYTTRRVVPQAA